MPIHSKKEFAALTGQTTKTLSTYILRGKVIVGKDGYIDSSNEVNASFMASHPSTKEEKTAPPAQIPLEETYKPPKIEDIEPEPDENGIPALHISDKKYKHFLALKTKASEELDRLKIEKLKGEVIPTAPIEVLVFQFKQYVLTQQKIAYEKFLNEISHKYSITGVDMAQYRTFFIKGLNTASAEASNLFVKDLSNILSQYSIK